MSDAHATAEYEAALASLFARTGGGSKYGLDRTRALLHAIGDPHGAAPVFHVAGTNGKGSTVGTLVALLRARGLRVGAYTSPHLVDFRERIAVDGCAIAPGAVTAFVRAHAALTERIGASFFEVTTALAFDHFARSAVDVAVIETGLGGRLDSTNVVDPLAAGVTAIGLDHTELLGDTLEAIAGEKAGIYKRGRPAIVGERDAHVRGVLAARAEAAGAAPVRVVAETTVVRGVALHGGGTRFDVEMPWGDRHVALPLETPLVGAFQPYNVVTALAMVDAAGARYRLPPDAIAGALRATRLPGRLQRVGRYLFDVAHNPDGARTLAASLAALDLPRPCAVLLAVLADKDWRGIVDALGPVADHLVLTVAPTAPPDRVWDLDAALAFAAARGLAVEAARDFDAALGRASASGETVVVTGSFHTVGDAMLRLQVDPLAA